MRDAFSNALVAAAKADPKVLLLTGDHGYALFDAFRKACPDQYINCGIAEQNMVGVAAGLAKAGYRPVVYGLAAFVPVRVVEQIKIDICYEQLPVILIGDGAGVVYSHLGASHQSFEDISVLRPIPHLSIYSPADRHELTASMDAMFASKSACYMRMGKADLGDVHEGPVTAESAIINVRDEKETTLIIATGSGVNTALQIADSLGGAAVYSVPRIKPFTAADLGPVIGGRKRIIVIEEHSVHGGLASTIAELIVGKFQGQFHAYGVRDQFSETCGDYRHLMQEHGLSAQAIMHDLEAA
ncbi:transketolase family protein [Pigmentiphaga litoralis]|uniref:Transketolase n=1 Tax=Pigmentiphaga litoralis TaxID=516702 RepID=A0A7Y9ISK5_9BURK|nr:transketolase C-terminal domain-containing protein [Pigmentiphaga litoralis]NYE24222.1 transketolase [Pigmentiphaga litoralis]NYE82164.1 transketolase [Pigmentiphaga litoralis]